MYLDSFDYKGNFVRNLSLSITYSSLKKIWKNRRIQEHKSASSSIGQHFRVKHSSAPKDFSNNFRILKKCKSKFDCLVFEMFFINELRPSLNVQSDSRRAKVFKWLFSIVVVSLHALLHSFRFSNILYSS